MAASDLAQPRNLARFGLLSALAVAAALIVATLASYPLDLARHPIELLGSLAALVVLAGLALWLALRRRGTQITLSPAEQLGIGWGVLFGALWVVEIAYNNLIAPPVAIRDPVDDVIWAGIALGMVIVAAATARRQSSVGAGVRAGFWAGLVSGTGACLAALTLVLFGMRFLLADPANVAEFAQRGPSSGFSTLAPYLAYQTLAGAMLHLVVLGMLMGTLLGAVGGAVGRIRLSSRPGN